MAEAQTMWLCRCGYLNPGRKPTCGDCGQFRDRGQTHTQNQEKQDMNKIITSLAFLACIVGANWALSRFGIVPVGFGLMAPAGVYFAGLSFGLRDAVQELGGRLWTVGLIVVGAALSALIDPKFALASGCAFLLAETADLLVYSPLRERRWVAAVVLSNVAGSIVDSAVFLYLAGFGVTASSMGGMVWGKAVMILPALVIVGWVRGRRAVAA